MPLTNRIKLALQQFSGLIHLPSFLHLPNFHLPTILSKYKHQLIVATIVILILGTAMIIATIYNQKYSTMTDYLIEPNIDSVTPTTSYESIASPLKELINNFSSQMPDPDPATFDDKISL